MAIDYGTNPTGLFYRAGKAVKALNAYRAVGATSYPADLAAITGAWQGAGLGVQVTGLYAQYAGWVQQVVAVRQALGRLIDVALTDPATVTSQLPGLQSFDSQGVAVALAARMVADGQTVKANAVAVGAVTPAAGNAGTGVVLLTRLLDGVQPPRNGAAPNPAAAGKASELAVTETMAATCVADSYGGGAAAGAESFAWAGGAADQPLGCGVPGSGPGPYLQAVAGDSDGHTRNGSFDSWTGAALDDWTVAGAPAVEAAAVLRAGGKSLKIPAAATVSVAQSPAGLLGRGCYCLSVWAKIGAGTAGGTLTVGLSGTGFTPLGGGGITQAVAGLSSTAWTLLSAFVVLPAALPVDLKLTLAGSPTGVDLYLDDAHLLDVTYHGGVGAVVVAGGTDFAAGDGFVAGVTNDNAGVFQTFFGAWYGVQLPSSGSPSISDSLAA